MIGFVEIFRGMPVIVVLFILYFGFPTIGVTLTKDPVVAGIVGLSLVLAAYLSEVFRAAIGAVDGGQLEAAHSLGMSGVKAYRRVVLPQALRIATPTVGGYLIQLFKDTSLLGFIGVTELMRKGQVIVSTTFRAFEVYITIGIIYLVVSVLAAFLIRRLEAKLTPGDARSKKTSSMNTGRGSLQLKVEL